jgi:chromosome segregation protein
METAQQSLAQSEAAAQGSEAAHIAARQKLEASRAPLNEADKRVQRLETEARTISKLVNGETKNLWPPIIDGVTVAKGYEKALGAALGDDLDAPVDPSAPMRWTNSGVTEGDPALPAGVEPLAAHVDAPSELTRRLAQIGVVPKERGAELVSQLKTGQRLVSPEGDVWRWDGFSPPPRAPTGAARVSSARGWSISRTARTGPHRRISQRQALETAEPS